MKVYYIDTCIWLNLFKKEGNPAKGVPYWKIANDFLEKVMSSEDEEIVYSSIILRELQYSLNSEELFKEKQRFFKEERFTFTKAIQEDYDFGRKLESEFRFEISFFDCIHIAICKRLNCILITRDKLLIYFAKKYIKVNKPEELLT